MFCVSICGSTVLFLNNKPTYVWYASFYVHTLLFPCKVVVLLIRGVCICECMHAMVPGVNVLFVQCRLFI